MYNEQQDYYSMNMTIEKHPSTVIEFKNIEAITDLEALGVYTYMKMLIDQEITKAPMVIEQVCKHFSMTEAQVLANIKLLNELGFMMIIKN